MAKIDTNAIEGYADMTPEQKVAALEAFNTPDPDYKGWVKKDVLDKATHDAAEWKRKYNSTLDESQVAANTQAEQMNALQAELESLRKDKTVSSYTAKFVAAGYDEQLASDTASAMADGDMERVFANQAKFLDGYAKNVRAESMKQTPRPPVGAASSGEPDYNAMADKAMQEGRMTDAAYYIRKAAEQEVSES